MMAFVLWSNDRGDTWHYYGTMAIDPANIIDYAEPGILRLEDGRLLSMLRIHHNPRCDPPGGYLYQTISEDGGATWSQPRKTELWGYPADLINLSDGRVLCTYGYRMYPNPGIRGCISEDGTTWELKNEFVIKAIPDLPPELMHIGYPSSVRSDDGTILTAYHVWAQERTQGYSPLEGWKQYIEGALYTV